MSIIEDRRAREEEQKQNLIAGAKKYGLRALIGFLLFITMMSSFIIVLSGESVRVQNNLTGTPSWYMTEGLKLKMPWFSNVETYSQEITVAITDNDELCDQASICGRNQDVLFADTYAIDLETSFRFSLPRTAIELEKMHDKVKTAANLEAVTLLPFAKDLVNNTAQQFKAENFMQGASGEFKNRLTDQATNGLLVTKRRKVEVLQEKGTRSSDRGNGTKVGKQFVWEVLVMEDKLGKQLRKPTAIKAYGVTIVPAGINLVEFKPEKTLKAFMTQKQDRVRARAKIVEEQTNERQQAITAQLKGDRQRIEQSNALLIKKDAAIIQGEQKVAQAKLTAEKETVDRQKVADLAIIDKRTQLQQAKANENIQKANAKSAKYQASAIKLKGFAEAAVVSAKLRAKQDNKTIYMAELKLEEARVMAEALPKTKITMPNIVNIGGGGTGSAQLSDLLSTKMALDIAKGSTVSK